MERRKINMDMLSGLPDEVLHHILSFLPTKLSVQTSVLAKRWRFLWALVPNLEFHGEDFRGENTKKNNKHLNIIDRVISMHEAKTLNTFSLIDVKGCPYRLETLIIRALKRNVRNLYLDFRFLLDLEEDIACALPRLIFTCKTLVELKLDNCGLISSSGEVFLPCLKKLDLSYVDYEDKESLPHLLSGCHVLEELIINDAYRVEETNLGCFIVSSSPTIKTLHVNFPSMRELYHDEMLIIDLPALVYLKVSYCYLEYAKSLGKTMASLIEADINLNGYWHDCVIDCTEHGRSRAFLSSLCYVRYLKISSDFEEEVLVDIVGTSSMPKFLNLTKLELDMNVDWHHLVKFLEVTDYLEVLVVKLYCVLYREPKRVPTCMLSRLRTVRINSFGYRHEDGFDVVRYILSNAQVLEMMNICGYSSSDKEKLDVHRKISLFQRGSKSCQLSFNRR